MTKEFCWRCGAVVPEGAQTCPACGAAQYAPTPDDMLQETAPRQAFAPPSQPAPPAAPEGAPAQYAPYPAPSGVWAPPAQPSYTPYPTYPGYPAAYPTGAGYPQAGAWGQPPSYGYPWGYYGPYYAPPQEVKRAPGETYALVISWIVTVASGLSILGGLLVTALASIVASSGSSDDLSFFGSVIGFSLAPVLGGAFGLWYGISGIRRRPSPRFGLPNAWLLLALALVAIGGGVALWQYNFSQTRAPGVALGMLPLVALAGALPALAILALTTQRLRDPSTRRHVWMSFFYGMTLAPLLAVIIEYVLSLIIIAALHLSGQDAQSVLGQPGVDSSSPSVLIAMLLVLSVVAPLVEESVKPLGALLAIRRLRTPAEAFLVGLAAGVGFDIFETIGYIGQGQADWVTVAIDRIGAGLLHGVGAGMATLGWYYFINGSGVQLRWLRGIGCGVYAVAQHALFNAFSFIGAVLPSNVNDWLNQPFYIGDLPLQNADIIYLGIYLYLIGFLLFMTRQLWHAKGMPERKPPLPAAPNWPAPYGPYGQYGYAPYAGYPGYAPYGPYGQPTAPGGGPTPAADAQQPVGGAR